MESVCDKIYENISNVNLKQSLPPLSLNYDESGVEHEVKNQHLIEEIVVSHIFYFQ